MARKQKYYAGASDGGQPVKDDAHAAAVLANGSNRSKQVPQTWGMKDRSKAKVAQIDADSNTVSSQFAATEQQQPGLTEEAVRNSVF